jgi:putative peptidoglycan lipid II flippase
MAALSAWFVTKGALVGDTAVWGSIFLSAGYLLGLFLQWLTQAWLQHVNGVGRFLHLRFLSPRRDPGMQQALRLLVPATVSSGMLQLATYTDMFFASFIPGAAACMGYANLLVMAPLGILSSAILVPAVPVFARFSEEEEWPLLVDKAQGVLVLSLAATLCLSAWLAPLAEPIVRVLFQRKAFGAAATASVAPLLVCYAFGASVYLVRDVLVRLLYALDEAGWTFYVSILALAANALLDWALCIKLGFGAPGLIVATTAVNVLSVLVLFGALGRKLCRGGAAFQWKLMAEAAAKLLLSSGVAIAIARGSFLAFDTTLEILLRGGAAGGLLHWALQVVAISMASVLSTAAFACLCVALRIPEAEDVARRIGRGLRKDLRSLRSYLARAS